jgi:hypothetical protein
MHHQAASFKFSCCCGDWLGPGLPAAAAVEQ